MSIDKYPDKQYVCRGKDSVILGWAIPFVCTKKTNTPTKTTAARMDKIKGWGSKGNNEFVVLDNPLQTGFKIGKVNSRFSTSNKFFQVTDPRGFMLEITAENLMTLITKCKINNGVIEDKLIWDKSGVLVNEVQYYIDMRICQNKVKFEYVKPSSVPLGATISVEMDGTTKQGTWLGRHYTLERVTSLKSKGINKFTWSKHKRDIIRRPTTSNYNHVSSYFLDEQERSYDHTVNNTLEDLEIRSNFKIVEVISLPETEITLKEASKIANDLLCTMRLEKRADQYGTTVLSNSLIVSHEPFKLQIEINPDVVKKHTGVRKIVQNSILRVGGVLCSRSYDPACGSSWNSKATDLYIADVTLCGDCYICAANTVKIIDIENTNIESTPLFLRHPDTNELIYLTSR